MKMWKKLMVFAVSILLISAILAAQYVSVQTGAVLSINTQHADLQLFAGDPSVAGESLGGLNHNYTLEYVAGDGFRLNLGTWGEQNEFISTAAFGVANAGGANIRIVGVRIEGDHAGALADSISMYAHGNEHGVELAGTHVDLLDGAWGYIQLNATAPGGAYDGGNLLIDGAANAEWVTSDEDGDHSLWYLDPAETLTFVGADEDEECGNAFWVRIEVDPSTAADIEDATIYFDVEYDW